MNKIYKFLAIAIIISSAFFASCAVDENMDERTPSPVIPGNCQGVFFPRTNKAVNEIEPTDPKEMTIIIARTDSTKALEVPITVERNDENVFVVPQKVNFTAGKKEVSFVVTFPTAAEGVTYNLKLAVVGDEFVNYYAETNPYVTTSVTRVKWDMIDGKIVMVNGFWSVGTAHYIPKAEIATYGSGDIVNSIRLTNPFPAAEGDEAKPDEYGVYNGHPDIWPDEVVRENPQIIITINKEDKALIKQGGIGCMWYDIEMQILMRSVAGYGKEPFGEVTRDGNGKIVRIDFPPGSLFIIANSANQGWASSGVMQIYLSWDAFLADNMKIDNFNEVEYEEIPGAVSEFESKAYNDGWDQSFAKAIDIDQDNPDSEYKDLYYLANLYAKKYGVAFYYNGKSISIPANQPIGKTVFQKQLFVSSSETVKSSVTTTNKGVTVYTLGLKFHYKDGTVLGDFEEKFYYSKDPVPGHISEFYGDYIISGYDYFNEDILVEWPVSISAGAARNTLVIDGIAWVGLVNATFNTATSFMSIAPQVLEPYTGIPMQLHTFLPTGYASSTAAMVFTKKENGQLVLTPTSPAIGFLIWAGGGYGYQECYYNVVFTPESSSKANRSSKFAAPSKNLSTGKELRKAQFVQKEKCSKGNFVIQPKVSFKQSALKYLSKF